MKKHFLFLIACLMPIWTMAVERIRMLPQAEQQNESSCYYYIVCLDSYGDGWNDAYIQTINGITESSGTSYTLFHTAKLQQGVLGLYQAEYDGDVDKFYWHKGTYDGECYFFIANQKKVGLYTKTQSTYLADSALFYTMNTNPCTSSKTYNLDINASVNNGIIQLTWSRISGAHHYKVILTNYTDEPDEYQFRKHTWIRYCMTDESFENTTNTHLDFPVEYDGKYHCMVLACNSSDEVICFDYASYVYTGTPIGSINVYFRPEEGVDFLSESGQMWVFYDNNGSVWVQEAVLQDNGWYQLSLSNITHTNLSFRALNTYTTSTDVEGTGIHYTQIMCGVHENSYWMIGNPEDDSGYKLTRVAVAEGATNLQVWDVGSGKYAFTWDNDPYATRYYLQVISKNPNPYSNKIDTIISCFVNDGLQATAYPILRSDAYEWYVYSLNEEDYILATVQGEDFIAGGGAYTPQMQYTFEGQQLVISWSTPAPGALVWCYNDITGEFLYLEETTPSGSIRMEYDINARLQIGIQSYMVASCVNYYIPLSAYTFGYVDMSSLFCYLTYDNPAHGAIRTSPFTNPFNRMENKQVTLWAEPDEHYYIYAWKVDGQLYPVSGVAREGSSITLTMDRDHHVSVIIKEKEKYRIYVYSSPSYYTDAFITPERSDHYYYKDEIIQISTDRNTRSGADKYHFDHWDNVPADYRYRQSFSWIVTGSKTLTAKWKERTRQPGGLPQPQPDDKKYTVTVHVYPDGAGTAAPNQTAYRYDERAVVTAEETNPDFEFAYWRQTGNTALTFDVNVRQNLYYTAVFKRKGSIDRNPNPHYCVQIRVDENGGGSVVSKDDPEKDLEAAYEKGTQLKIKANPDPGYEFAGWSDGISTNPRTITVNDNNTYCPLEASFKQKNDMEGYRFRLSCSPMEAGEIVAVNPSTDKIMSINTTYPQGTRIKVTVQEQDGWHFTKWSDNSTRKERTFTVQNNIILTAFFERDENGEPGEQMYNLSLVANDGGMVNAEIAGQYPTGAQVEIIATPMEKYAFSHWSNQLGDTLYELRSTDTITILSDTTLIAHFADSIVYEEYYLDLHIIGGGTILNIAELDGLHAAGERVQLEAQPFDGYVFTGWSDGIITPERSITMDRDYSLTAQFRELKEYLFSYFINDTLLGSVEAYEDRNDSILYKDTFLYEGTPISLYAIPFDNYSFHSWRANNIILAQEKEWQFCLSQDTVITAYFSPYAEAIQHVHVNELDVHVIGKNIIVHAPEATDMYVISASGQMVTSAKNTDIASFHVPATGLYVIRTKNESVKVIAW